MKRFTTAVATLLLSSTLFAGDLKLAQQYIDLPANQNTIKQMLSPQMLGAQIRAATGGKLNQAQMDKIINVTSEELSAALPQMSKMMTKAAASTFNDRELEAMIEFYSSPVGESSAAKLAPFMMKYSQLIAPLMQQMMQNTLAKIQ